MADRDWLDIVDEVAGERRQSLASTFTGVRHDPDQAARANRLSDRLGQPFGVVSENLDDFEEDARRQDVANAGAQSPHVAEFLSDPRRMALASDEAPKLAAYANALAAEPQKDWAQDLLANAVRTGLGIFSNVRRTWHGDVRQSDVRDTGDALRSIPAGAVRGAGMAVAGVGEGYNLAERTLDRGLGAAGVEGQPAATRDDIPIFLRPGDSFIGAGQHLKNLADWIAPPVERQGFGTQVAEGVGQAGPMLLQAVYAPQSLVATSYGMGVDQMADAVRQKGAYGTGQGDAAIAIGGVMMGALERTGIEQLAERLPPNLRSSTLRYLADISIAGATEAATEAGQQVAQNASVQALVDPSQSLTEGVADNAQVGGAVGSIMRAVLGLPGVPRSRTRMAAEELQRVIQSRDANERLAKATNLAAELKLGERSPEDLKAITRAAVAGGEDARVYLDAEQAQVLFQSEPNLLQEMVGGQEALIEQIASGQLTIPFPQWVATVSRMPNRDEVLRHARQAPDWLSPAELESFDPDALAAELGAVETDDAAERAAPQLLQARQQIEQDVMGQLMGTGRYSKRAAEAQAKLFAAGISTLAGRAGLDAGAVYQRHMGGIRSGRSDGSVDPQAKRPFLESGRIDALLSSIRSTDGGATAAEQFGPSLASWLVAEGGLREEAGELRARDAGKLRPGLVSRAGMPLDTARELAAEAGFIPADGDVNSLLDALDSDLRGNPVYSPALGDTARQQFELDRQSLLDAIENTPALRDMPADEFRAMTNQQVADLLGPADVFGQAGAVTGTPAFKRWFGDSQVVDEQGSPLKVFHGTGEEFEAFKDVSGRSTGHATASLGHFFTADQALAQRYAEKASGGIPADERVIDAYLSIQNPYRMSLDEAQELDSPEASRAFRQFLERQGFDGVHIEGADSWIAFRPEQIKSASGNSGAFDPGNPSILNQGPAARDLLDSPEFKDWFGDRTIEQLEAEYAALPATDGGRRIDTDLVRELAPAYVADRSRSQELHPYASRLTKELFARALARPVAGGRLPIVQFLAGGGGSGKSTATASAVAAGNADIIFDGTLSNLVSAQRDIAASLASGRGVRVDFVYRSPEKSVEGAIGRAIRAGRPVPVWALADAHSGAPRTVKALAKEYDSNQRVLIAATWNDGEFGKHRPMPVEEIPDVDREQAEQTFREAVERAFQDGRASVGLRDAFNAGRGGAEDVGRVREDRPEQSAGDAVTEQTPPTGGVSASGGSTFFQRISEGVRSLFQPKKARGAKRGQIEVFPDRRMAISLFESADRSTFLHETGHFFLEVYRDLAAMPDAPQPVRDDFDALLKWMGVESADQIGRDQHEQFARGFEHYLAEGRAPSVELQSVFSQFKAWLRGIYRNLRSLDVNLTDDVRGVMDRMLAADEQIEVAQARQGMVPLARTAAEAEALGMTEQQWQDYIAKVDAASEDAKAEVLARLVQSQQRAMKRWWKEERATVLAEVLAEYGNLPAERLARVLAGAKTYSDGTPIPDAERVHLDRQALVDGWGDAYLGRLKGLYRNEGGVSPDLLAPLYGFESGDALVKALANRTDMRARAEAEADVRMLERHGDPFTDGTLPELAMEAVHGNRRVQVLERELKVLADLAGQPAPSSRVLAVAASEIVQGKSSREVRPNDHLAAERRAARVALQAAAKGDYAGALQAKRQQAFNAAMFKATRDAREEFGRIERLAKGLAEKASQERLAKAGNGFFPQVNGILAAYGFGKAEPGEARSLMAWLDGLQDSGEVTAVADSIIARLSNPAQFRDIPLAEARELREALRNLSHLASRQNQVLAGARKVDREEAVAELLERPGSVLGEAAEFVSEKDLPFAQRAERAVVNKLDDITRVENIIEKLDGGEAGPWHDFIWHAQEQAEVKKNQLMRRVGGLLKKLHEGLPSDWADSLNKPVTFKGVRISRGRLISMAMNMGNAGNKQRLMNGGFATNTRAIALSEADLTVLGSMLTTTEWTYVQGMWDAIGSMRPDIEALNNRMGGVPIHFVQAEPLTVRTADGDTIELAGGYFPIAYDSSRSRVGDVQSTEDAMQTLMASGAARAATSKGHTKGRADEISAALLLDYGQVVHRHLDQVMTDLAYRETVRDVQMLLKDPRIRSFVTARLSESAWRSLMGGLAHSVVGSTAAAGSVSNWRPLVDGLLANTTVAALAIRPDLALGNYGSALLQGMDRAGRVEVMKALADFQANRTELTQSIVEKSPFMAGRLQEVDYLYSSALNQVQGNKWKGRHAAYTRTVMSLHRYADADVARVVWLARYGIEKRKGAEDAEAVRLADKAVRMTQTATAKKDLSTFERDASLRQTRQYMGPMFVIFGRLRAATEGSGATRSGSARMMSLLLQWVLAPAAFALLSGRLPDDDDDDDGKDWMTWLVKEIGLFPVQTMPLVRDVAALADSYLSGRQPNSRSAPLATAISNMGKAGKRMFDNDFDGDSWDEFTVDLLQLAGPLVGAPAAQAKRWKKAFDAMWDDPDTGSLELTQMAVYGEAPFYADGEPLPAKK